MKVGIIGLGRMGEGMSRRMMKDGIEVWGYRRNYEKAQEAYENGYVDGVAGVTRITICHLADVVVNELPPRIKHCGEPVSIGFGAVACYDLIADYACIGCRALGRHRMHSIAEVCGANPSEGAFCLVGLIVV